MEYEVSRDRMHPEDWRVEASDFESEGECYVTIFSGWLAAERAREYADWKNSQAKLGLDRQYETSASMVSTQV